MFAEWQTPLSQEKINYGQARSLRGARCLVSAASIDLIKSLPSMAVIKNKTDFDNYTNLWFADDVEYWPPFITFELSRLVLSACKDDLKITDLSKSISTSFIRHWNKINMLPNLRRHAVFSEVALIYKWLMSTSDCNNTDDSLLEDGPKKQLQRRMKDIVDSNMDVISSCTQQINLSSTQPVAQKSDS